MILGVPWWVLAVILLIFFSGYMAFRAMVAERKLEQQNAEREGKIFIERMIKEKEQREKDRQQTS
ncbi:sporulation YhaL family protein [Oceanobacillus caeni]|uniref:sporulation YhaL family protein n=1 Tax=Bacillaceae TaxID=186817 RepID=UPI00069BBCF2|nr:MULTISPECIES: sporulation YhaL family protein [Bacillaceae]PZD87687.1 SigE-dependent sporulation protein [Bacilli bacterium]MBU8790382.1 sporulation YhaL family protein [Oceanobacillus caeni]MCR1834617.1 sporulation YhaL family protein [Oceanobacillus caeni]MED4476429.1 sporulation YhaL family protein [Oceanobacillus caeni]PZD90726.1 SigE-dependent sporulation protein [Bacilli bacterium]